MFSALQPWMAGAFTNTGTVELWLIRYFLFGVLYLLQYWGTCRRCCRLGSNGEY